MLKLCFWQVIFLWSIRPISQIGTFAFLVSRFSAFEQTFWLRSFVKVFKCFEHLIIVFIFLLPWLAIRKRWIIHSIDVLIIKIFLLDTITLTLSKPLAWNRSHWALRRVFKLHSFIHLGFEIRPILLILQKLHTFRSIAK
jgi:hypothetical protein